MGKRVLGSAGGASVLAPARGGHLPGGGVKGSKPGRRAGRRAGWRGVVVSVLCLVVGAGLLLYPVFATVVNNSEHSRIVNEVMDRAGQVDPQVLDEELDKAREFNSQTSHGPIFDPFLEEVVPDSEEYHHYASLLDFGGVMGSVQIPAIGVKLPIYHGTSDETLGKGVGHLFGSSLPVGGASTKAVLTAHSGLGTATMFDNLPKLVAGDNIYVSVAGQTLQYQVVGSTVVEPTQTEGLQIENGKDLIVLVTCTPYGVNTHRLLVTAQRVPYVAEQARRELSASDSPWQTWMWFSVAVVGLAVGLYAWRVLWAKKRRRNNDNPDDTSDNPGDASPSDPGEGPDNEGDSSDPGSGRPGDPDAPGPGRGFGVFGGVFASGRAPVRHGRVGRRARRGSTSTARGWASPPTGGGPPGV